MAKNTEKKGSNKTSKGTMPADKLVRFKLKGNISSDRVVSRNTKLVKKFAESIKHYRQSAHGVNESRLPSCFRMSAHYFTIPLTRADSDNPRDKRGLVDASSEQPTSE